MIQSGGYKLYTTQVTSIQNAVLKEMAKKVMYKLKIVVRKMKMERK